MFRSLLILAILATPAPLLAQRGRVSQGCPSCAGGNCAAPQAAPTAQAGFQWLPGATANESALYVAGKQVGGYHAPTNTYRPFADGKYGEPCKPPVPLPSAQPAHEHKGPIRSLLSRLLPLDDVNEQRHARGLPPYQHDPALTEAARRCAEYRAQRRMAGHTDNDFQFLQGASSDCAGCAAWPQDMRFGSCAMFERRTFAGAATVQGADGLNYHQLFVR